LFDAARLAACARRSRTAPPLLFKSPRLWGGMLDDADGGGGWGAAGSFEVEGEDDVEDDDSNDGDAAAGAGAGSGAGGSGGAGSAACDAGASEADAPGAPKADAAMAEAAAGAGEAPSPTAPAPPPAAAQPPLPPPPAPSATEAAMSSATGLLAGDVGDDGSSRTASSVVVRLASVPASSSSKLEVLAQIVAEGVAEAKRVELATKDKTGAGKADEQEQGTPAGASKAAGAGGKPLSKAQSAKAQPASTALSLSAAIAAPDPAAPASPASAGPTAAKFVVFSRWLPLLRRAQAALTKKGLRSVLLTKRAAAEISLFREQADVTCLMVCTQAGMGAAGLNLTIANNAVFLEPSLSPALEAQAIGRVHRSGQVGPLPGT
jgi:hypothetical protein